MKLIFLDFETYYSDEYSLRKMTPVEYILDQRFEANGLAVQEGLDGLPRWVDGPDIADYLATLDPQNTCIVTHNALFDQCILMWRYNFNPRLISCTMSIARAVLGHSLKSVSLAAVSKYLGLPDKGGMLHKVKGMTLPMIQAAKLYDEYVEYGLTDAGNCAGIYKELVVNQRAFPISELAMLDMVLRCAIQPQFVLDEQLLVEHAGQIKVEKDALLAQALLLGADGKSALMSNDKFAAALKMVGCEPPRKISLITGQETWAFAKKDPEFLALLDDDNPAVQTLIAARLGHKSTLEETRTNRLLNIVRCKWPEHMKSEFTPEGKLMPMPFRFSGAHTHRLSGDWSLNVQNLPRGSKLRRAIMAPPGHVVMTVDASQIEARLTAWLCRQQDLVDQFARGEDVYANFASNIFGIQINRKDNPSERFIGKTGILGLGFGVGAPKFQNTVQVDSKLQTGNEIKISLDEAKVIVGTYRSQFFLIPAAWADLGSRGIEVLQRGGNYAFGPCVFEQGQVRLPSGLCLFYKNLRECSDGWYFSYGATPTKKLYGGKMLENIVQALDRVIVFDAALRIQRRIKPYRLAQQAHDELAYVVREADADAVEAILMEEMTRVPAWATGLPLAAEVGRGATYGDAK